MIKKTISILIFSCLTVMLSAQSSSEKGSLLLEGNLSGTAWTSIATNGSVFGLYLNDGFAMTIGYVIGIVDDETLTGTFGARIHFTESQLLKIDLSYDDYTEVFGAYMGVANRFYYKDWMSIEPQVGLGYSDEAMILSTKVGFNLHFPRW